MEQLTIDMIPTGAKSVGHASQFDIGRIIRFNIVNKGEPVTLTGAETIKLLITKPDGTKLEKNIANTSSTYVDWVSSEGDYDQTGVYSCELKITNNTQDIGSKNFIVKVEEDPYSEGGIVTETASGDPAVFNTNMVELFIEIKCNINAVQNGTPWIDSNIVNKEPYLFRKIAGTASRIGNSEFNKIVGGTVAFNQLVVNGATSPIISNDVTATKNADNSWDISGTASNNVVINIDGGPWKLGDNHVYFIAGSFSGGSASTFAFGLGGLALDFGGGTIWKNSNHYSTTFSAFVVGSGVYVNLTKVFFRIHDLTAMFGTTIADYIYSLEQATAGAGVAWFKALFPKSYYAYNAGELISVKTSAHNTIGFNQWDEVWEIGGINGDGQPDTATNRIRSVNFIPLVPNTTYYIKVPNNCGVYFYDDNQAFISANIYANETITPPANARYLKFTPTSQYGTTYKHDICINISDANRNGTYEPYSKHEYNLDSDLELRGILKLDGSNNLYYDGDTYESNGSVTRKYGIVDLGSLEYAYNSTRNYFTATVSGIKRPAASSDIPNLLSDIYTAKDASSVVIGTSGDMCIAVSSAYDTIMVVNQSYTDPATFKTAMNGIYLVYELATPTTETADPFTNPMQVDGNGTEEFVDGRAVEIPVGHESFYADIYQISGHTELNLFKRGINQWDEEWEVGYINTSTGNNSNADDALRSKNYIHVVNNTTYYVSAVNCDTAAKRIRIYYYDKSKAFISYVGLDDAASGNRYGLGVFTTPANCAFIRFTTANQSTPVSYNNDISINYPSTDHDYHAYEGELVTVAFGQTVYTGVLDVETGKLKITKIKVDLGSLNWSYVTSGSFPRFQAGLPQYSKKLLDNTKIADVISELFYVNSWANVTNVSSYDDTLAINSAGNTITIHDSTYTNAASFKAIMSGIGIAYELETPTEVQLTARQLETILGENIISHDCNGTTDVKYLYEA